MRRILAMFGSAVIRKLGYVAAALVVSLLMAVFRG